MISTSDRPRRFLFAALFLVTATLLLSLYLSSTAFDAAGPLARYCSGAARPAVTSNLSDEAAEAILRYATSPVTPQQSIKEIRISLDVLLRRRPCNFLVFGLGHDSRMWNAFNAGGRTLFLEEDPKWVQSVLRDAPHLAAESVRYPTQLKEADVLLRTYRDEASCLPARAYVQGNSRCRLALGNLPAAVYEREWDLIMIDAPRGYFPEAPGRMGAIWTAAVMARNRKGDGHTDIFLHDVDRKVEKEFAREFLCDRYRVSAEGRLWHFRIPAVRDRDAADGTASFC